MNPYINDILSQPVALRRVLDQYPSDQIEPLRARLQAGEFDRIVITGMGASLNASYPAWLKLISLHLPVVFANAAEILHYGENIIGPHTLLWINSQSGRSVEVVRLLELLQRRRPAFQISMSNFLDSPMAQTANLAVPIYAGVEATVSTKTYLNMLAMLLLATTQLIGGDWQTVRSSMQKAANEIEAYLAAWQEKVADLDALLGDVDQLVILGRGASLAAVWYGSLISKEAAKCIFEGMNAADFRHGPLELASPRLTLLIFEGDGRTSNLNRDLALEAARYGSKAIWVASKPDEILPTHVLPFADENSRPLVETLPMQILTLVMAKKNRMEPGVFRHVGKVTLAE